MERLKTLAHEILNGGWQLQVATGAFACMAGILLLTLLFQIGDFTHYVSSPDDTQNEQQLIRGGTDTTAVNQIVQNPIFGMYVEQKIEKINTTLDLLGIMMATDPQYRRAFIAEPNKDASVYREGDDVSNGLKVHRIYPDKVLLLRYGKPETLYIAWEQDLLEGQLIKPKAVKRPAPRKRINAGTRNPKFNREEYMQKIRERLGKYGRDGLNLNRFQRNFRDL